MTTPEACLWQAASVSAVQNSFMKQNRHSGITYIHIHLSSRGRFFRSGVSASVFRPLNLKTEGIANAGRSKRLWWSGIFDFHTEREVRRRPRTRKRPTSGKRKVLRAKNRFRKGIGVCMKDPWFIDERIYAAKREDPSCKTPWIINSISTDGSRVFRCESQMDEGRTCPVGMIDRDTNGSVNIGVCCVHQLLGLARPSFFCR